VDLHHLAALSAALLYAMLWVLVANSMHLTLAGDSRHKDFAPITPFLPSE